MFLALISLEHVYAVFWPMSHRATSVRAYIFSIVIVWAAKLGIGGLSFMLTVYNLQVNTVYVVVTVDVLLFSCLVVMCASYLSIRSRLYSTTRSELQASHRRSTQDQI